MIDTKILRTLTLSAPVQAGRPSFVTAASGLVKINQALYIVADDENHLAEFHLTDSKPGRVHTLFTGELPVEPKSRKKVKPDLEALTLLPSTFCPPHGALMAIPSGSKPNRVNGAIIALDQFGEIKQDPIVFNLAPLFEILNRHFDPPNIESAWVIQNTLCLINRGNNKEGRNALIEIHLPSLLAEKLSANDLLGIYDIALPQCDGVDYTITDATSLDEGHLVFAAVAEDTENPYDDGPCLGAGIGFMDLKGKVLSFDTLKHRHKLEGIAVWERGPKTKLLLVNDEDDHTQPSTLLYAEVSK